MLTQASRYIVYTRGGVLFIDEAYSLCDAYENGYGDEAINTLVQEMDNLVTWQYNGSKSTIDEFSELRSDEKQDIINFIKDFLIYEEVTVSDRGLYTGTIII